MAIELIDGDPRSLAVTHPAIDRIAFGFVCILGLASVVWMTLNPGFPATLTQLFAIALLIVLFLTLRVFRTRVVVSRDRIEERYILKKAVALPPNARVEKSGLLVAIVDDAVDFEYRFSKYLSHGRSLEHALRGIFEGDGCAR